MIEYRHGNLVNVTEGVVAHGCNAQGVMGSGVAAAVKTRWPSTFISYKHYLLHQNGGLGGCNLVKIKDSLYVANCITQEYYGREKSVCYVSYAAIAKCFNELRLQLSEMNQDFVINIPMIGAGLGGGNWNLISAIIQYEMPNHRIIYWEL